MIFDLIGSDILSKEISHEAVRDNRLEGSYLTVEEYAKMAEIVKQCVANITEEWEQQSSHRLWSRYSHSPFVPLLDYGMKVRKAAIERGMPEDRCVICGRLLRPGQRFCCSKCRIIIRDKHYLPGKFAPDSTEFEVKKLDTSYLTDEEFANLVKLLNDCAQTITEDTGRPRYRLSNPLHPLHPVYKYCIELNNAAVERGMPEDRCPICGHKKTKPYLHIPYCYNCGASISQRYKVRGKEPEAVVSRSTHQSLLRRYTMNIDANHQGGMGTNNQNDRHLDDNRFPESYLTYENYKDLKALLEECYNACETNSQSKATCRITSSNHPLHPVYEYCVRLREQRLKEGMPADKCLICGSDLRRDNASKYPYCPTCGRFILQNHKIRDLTTIREATPNRLCIVCHKRPAANNMNGMCRACYRIGDRMKNHSVEAIQEKRREREKADIQVGIEISHLEDILKPKDTNNVGFIRKVWHLK